MSPIPHGPRGMYFEEFEPGQKIVSAGRTVSESDIISFAGLSGDFNQIHVDAEFSKTSLAGRRVAHGILGLSIASGLLVQTGLMDQTVIFFREITEWKFLKPIFIGDTIHVEAEVMETKEMRRLNAGMVTIELSVLNQESDVVQKGSWVVLVALKAAS